MAVVRIDIGPQPRNEGQPVMALELTSTGAVKLYAEEKDLDLAQLVRILDQITQYMRTKILDEIVEGEIVDER